MHGFLPTWACAGVQHSSPPKDDIADVQLNGNVHAAGSDAILTRCLWTVGLAITDPGYATLPPGIDPATFPDTPLHIDDKRELPHRTVMTSVHCLWRKWCADIGVTQQLHHVPGAGMTVRRTSCGCLVAGTLASELLVW